MVMLQSDDLGSLNPQATQISTFCITFHIFLVGERTNFKFSIEDDQLMDYKPSPKRVWLHRVAHFKFLVPYPYLWNG